METLSANCPIALPTPGATTREGVSVGAVAFTGVKVFSATRAKDREELGDALLAVEQQLEVALRDGVGVLPVGRAHASLRIVERQVVHDRTRAHRRSHAHLRG